MPIMRVQGLAFI